MTGEKDATADHIVDANKMVDAPAEMRGEIEHDPYDLTREYIPLPGGWEVQTKGAGSTYRLLDKKTGERFAILTGKDWKPLQAFFTRFAHEVFAASRDERRALEARALAAEAALAAERERCARVVEDWAEMHAGHLSDDGPTPLGRHRVAMNDGYALAAAIRAEGE